MKKCVIVSDSFKGTLSSQEICEIARELIPKFFPDCETVTIPVADGGEGTVDCFMTVTHAPPVQVQVAGPYGESREAVYTQVGSKAVIEMASAAGLPLVGDNRDPERTTTYGVGQMIRHAVENGCTEILLGLGGSATNDGGCGCAAALGTKFLGADGVPFIPTGGNLDQIRHIDISETKDLLRNVHITAMCDIENPMYGPTGAAYIYGPQKGAGEESVLRLDRQLRALDRRIQEDLGLDLAQQPGTGAAGAMGAGCIAFLGAELKSGIEAILDLVDFDSCLDGADLVITGEGRIDSQSVSGKVLSGIARRTRPREVPLVCIVGSVDDSASCAYGLGVTAMFGIDRGAEGFGKFAHKSKENYKRTLEDVLRLIKAVERRKMYA